MLVQYTNILPTVYILICLNLWDVTSMVTNSVNIAFVPLVKGFVFSLSDRDSHSLLLVTSYLMSQSYLFFVH